MHRLRACVLSHISSSPSTSHIFSLRRFLSATAPAPPISPNPSFAVEDYLVDTCSLTRAQALKASAKLSHLKSPSKPDAVLAFLAGLGLSGADVAAAVVKDPRLLCAGVDTTLGPNLAELTGLGLSRPDIARLLSLAHDCFRYRSVASKLQYYLPLLGSSDNLLRVLKNNAYLRCSLDKVVKPNVVLLRDCGLDDSDIAKLCLHTNRILTTNPARVRAMVACAEGLGVPRGSRMFRVALQGVAFLSEEKIAVKVDFLKKTFRWSDAQVSIALAKAPFLLRRSKDMLWRSSEFFISEVGLEPEYIAHRPAIICYSMEGRLRPRYYVLKFLRANGLLDHDPDYYGIVNKSEVVFVKKFIRAHKEAAPHLADDYAATCKGEVPTNFRFA